MSKYEDQLLQTVDMRGTVSVQELSRLLGVSDQTIRRVSRPLVERGDLRKVHGALMSNRPASDPPFLARMNVNRAAKVAIARQVAEIIGDGDSVAIDTGSTSAFVAQALRSRRNLSVVTNSAFVASTLAMIPGNNVSMAGTQLRDHDGAAFDRSAFEVIERMQVDYVLLSASMVEPDKGFLVHEQCEVDIATAMLANASRAIMAVDHSKFQPQSRKPALRQPTLKPGDILVSDKPPPAAFDALCEGLDLRLG
ncbi:transcriptional regulator, DeoR family [Cribrihabitans marinus]|uniref:Transcriptional regulator, DeoR family n=1 Tax=Cribrihabitans marinus TaxID=1227549 RepID=A0A1H7D5P0_9RHOB|nr:DeoR/GlpR family DNA-binding transcription regulator [Cribrihabitans marinus]GGH37777.1 glycerol-3-phosphate regulon repressor [Cribrihabitans marinus]SEJ97149.1 transcriptional regulator, DeoR family [Cribrihabitans marinus]